MALDPKIKEALDAELFKIGETGAKILNGLFAVLGNVAVALAPLLERIATNALGTYMQTASDRALKRAGIDPAVKT